MALETLPVFAHEEEIVETVFSQKVTLIVGGTGCGKTTQIPLMLAKRMMKKSMAGRVLCTQPRRIPCIQISRRVRRESTRKGLHRETVGYKIRFEADFNQHRNRLLFVTDGILLSMLSNPSSDQLENIKIIVIDEAHERGINSDILLGLLKNKVETREDLKLVVMSATLDEHKFKRYFSVDNLISIQGRLFPVEVFYSNYKGNYIDLGCQICLRIHFMEDLPKSVLINNSTGVKKKGRFSLKKKLNIKKKIFLGDILFFLPGKYEINCAEKLLQNLLENTDCEEYSIHRLYSDQDPMKIDEAIQKKRAGQGRRIILSTNVAETSLTIEDVKYVIDCGFQRRNLFLPKNDGTTVLETVVISRASADQRKGRAGRTQAGKCYRLYSEQIFSQKFTPSTPEDMIREDVSSVVLHLFAMGYSEPWNFDFITPPTPCQLGFSFKRLIEFGAIEENGEGMFKITEFGEQIVRLPLDVEDAVCMIKASECNVQLPIAKIIAIKQFQERLFVIDGQVKQWVHPQGDHLSLLNIMEAYLHVKDKHNFRFSLKNLHLREDTLKKAYRIYIQLANKFSGYENMNSRHKDYYPTILKCLLFGKRHNVAYFKRKHTYVKFPSLRMVLTLDRKLFMKHMHYNPLFIFYDKARFSEYQIKAQITSLCRPEWIKEIWEQDGSWDKLQRDRKRIFNSIEEQLIITEY